MELLSTVTDQPANVGELQELPIQGWSRDADPVNNRLFFICTPHRLRLGPAKETTAQDIYFELSTFYTFTPYDSHKAHTSPLPTTTRLEYFEEEEEVSGLTVRLPV